ncbi:MAG: sulfatase-like hydrolase/transferase [Candidatus Binataceae bacterium]
MPPTNFAASQAWTLEHKVIKLLKPLAASVLILLLFATLMVAAWIAPSDAQPPDRSSLPIPDTPYIRPNEAATVAEILKLNGYNTAAFGKMHQTPAWEVSVSGPFTRWPIGDGFEKFYGFLGGETNQWAPMVFDGVAHVEPAHTPGYNFMTDMTDHAIAWMRFQDTMTPDKPFFIYFAPGALHAPHHTPQVWRDRYKGKFDEGWDKYREATLARQKRLGVVPQNTRLAPWPSSVKHWSELSDDDKRVAERLMENYAGFGEYADHEIGRLIDSLKDAGVFDNTVIIYIAGDNGMSAEGGLLAHSTRWPPLMAFPTQLLTSSLISTISADQTVSRTFRWDGPWRAIRHSNGPSRLRRITAAPATGWLWCGRRGSRTPAASGRSGIT